MEQSRHQHVSVTDRGRVNTLGGVTVVTLGFPTVPRRCGRQGVTADACFANGTPIQSPAASQSPSLGHRLGAWGGFGKFGWGWPSIHLTCNHLQWPTV